MKQKLSILKKPAITVGVLAFWFLIWQLIALWYNRPLILPMPTQVFPRLIELLFSGTFWQAAGTTCGSLLLGYVIGCAVGFLFGCLVAKSKVLNALFTPLFSTVRATPVACFIIIAWVFLGPRRLPAFISALMVAPVMMTNVSAGIAATPQPLLETAQVYQLSLWDKVRVCYLPAIKPHALSALLTCAGLGWKAGIAAEVIALSANTLGYAVYQAKSWYMDAVDLFAWTVAIVLIELTAEALLKLVIRLTAGEEVRVHANA